MGAIRRLLGLEVKPESNDRGEMLLWVCPGPDLDHESPGAHPLTAAELEESDPGVCPIHGIDLFEGGEDQ